MKLDRFLEGLVIGGLAGALAALLLTPQSGDQLRGQIQSRITQVRSEVNNAASSRRIELEQQLAALRAPRKPGTP